MVPHQRKSDMPHAHLIMKEPELCEGWEAALQKTRWSSSVTKYGEIALAC